MLTFRQVIDTMNTGEPFTCRVITYSASKKRGGLVRRIEAQIIQRLKREDDRADTPLEARQRKAQNHDRHHTRNVVITIDGHKTEQERRIRIPLIIEFNGQPVVP